MEHVSFKPVNQIAEKAINMHNDFVKEQEMLLKQENKQKPVAPGMK